MKNYFIILLGLICAQAFGQKLEPVKWQSEIKIEADGTYSLIVSANIQDNWFLYSQHTDPSGPVPTEFAIQKNEVELIGDFVELSKPKKGMSEMFGVEVIKFSKKARFSQRFKPNGAKNIEGTVRFMTCDNLRCLPPTTISFKEEL